MSIDSNLKRMAWSKMPTLTIRMIKHRRVLENGNAPKENRWGIADERTLKVRRSK